MTTLRLPTRDGPLIPYTMGEPKIFENARGRKLSRIAFAAPHMVSDPFAHENPWEKPVVSWDATLGYRRYLWKLGLGVAEAMDTSHRGAGLDWPTALKLIRRSIDAAQDYDDAVIFSGAGTDHLIPGSSTTLDDVIDGYELQCSEIEKLGGRIVLMCSRGLARVAQGPDDYQRVYARVLSQLNQPVILHWLGDMFDPMLKGYWGYEDLDKAMDVCLDVIAENKDKVIGIKMSLLDKAKEVSMRNRLPDGVEMYTGDDFNYPELIEGDSDGFSHALLGIFDPIAPAAAAALAALEDGRHKEYHTIMDPTVALARHMFRMPTRFFKTGVVFMAYLNAHQNHFVMLGGQQSARSLPHLGMLFQLADKAGLFMDPDTAASRMKKVMAVYGIDQ